MKRLPEIRVTRNGSNETGIVWDPCDGEPSIDLYDMKVLRVKRDMGTGEIPAVEVTFLARLVEEDEE